MAAGNGGWVYDDFQGGGEHMRGADIGIDAHILATPAIADIDGDGTMDLVVPVSHFYDQAYYDSIEHQNELPRDVERSMYVASAMIAFDLTTHAIKWMQHLDLTTDHVDYRCEVGPAGPPVICHNQQRCQARLSSAAWERLFARVVLLGADLSRCKACPLSEFRTHCITPQSKRMVCTQMHRCAQPPLPAAVQHASPAPAHAPPCTGPTSTRPPRSWT